jgi:DNA-directed RNA polymerase specialized sigma24 family protein
LDVQVSREREERYRRAVARLPAEDRDLVVARTELGYSFQDIATLFGKPSAAAARMAVNRAVDRLTALMEKS